MAFFGLIILSGLVLLQKSMVFFKRFSRESKYFFWGVKQEKLGSLVGSDLLPGWTKHTMLLFCVGQAIKSPPKKGEERCDSQIRHPLGSISK